MPLINCSNFYNLYDLDINKANQVYCTTTLKDISEKYNVIENGIVNYKKILPNMVDMRIELLKKSFKCLKDSFFYHPWINESNMSIYINKNILEECNHKVYEHIWEYEDSIFNSNFSIYNNPSYKEENIDLYFSTWNLCMPFKQTPYGFYNENVCAITFNYYNNKGKYIILNKSFIKGEDEKVKRFYYDITKDNISFYSNDVNDMIIELKYNYDVFGDCNFWKICEINDKDEVTLF